MNLLGRPYPTYSRAHRLLQRHKLSICPTRCVHEFRSPLNLQTAVISPSTLTDLSLIETECEN